MKTHTASRLHKAGREVNPKSMTSGQPEPDFSKKNAKRPSVWPVLIMLAVPAITAGADDWTRGGGYTGPSTVTVRKISDVKTLPDDTDVVLEGRITERLGNEKYLFSDGADTIALEIDDDDWHGLKVGAEDTVILYGEVDRGFGRIEIDVDRIEKKNQ
jgi:uncharacterized protein (TIGR00156 family)